MGPRRVELIKSIALYTVSILLSTIEDEAVSEGIVSLIGEKIYITVSEKKNKSITFTYFQMKKI
jgi:hypothetical protein